MGVTTHRPDRRTVTSARAIVTSDERAPGFTGLTHSPLFATVAVLTGLAAVGAAVLPPLSTAASVVIVVTVVVLAGIPHGAVDHLVARSADPAVEERQAGDVDRSDRGFHVRYVSAIVAVLGVWAVAPAAALALFLLVSIHHFGQSDLAWCRLSVRRQLPLQWSRGLLLVGLPLVAHLDAIGPTIERLGGGRPDQWAWLTDRAVLWSAMLIAQHAAVGAMAVRRSGIDARWIRRETVGLTLVVAVLVVADPLVGFAVYFGLWHSLGHVLAVRQALADRSDPEPSMIAWREFWRLALPRTVVSAAGIVAVIVGCHLLGRADDAVAILFVMVSAITVPHLVVVERMWTGAAVPAVARSRR